MYSPDAAGAMPRGPEAAPARSTLLEGRSGNRRPARFPIIGIRSRRRVFVRREDFFLCSAATLAYENSSCSPKISAYCFFRPYRAHPFSQVCHPRLTPWAVVFRRFSAGFQHEILRKFLLFGVRFFSKFGLYPQGTDWYYASVTCALLFLISPKGNHAEVTMPTERKHREEIVRYGRMLHEHGFVAAMDGNLSVRLKHDRILVTPTCVSKGAMKPTDMVIVDMDGKKVAGRRNVTSELGMHLLVYRNRPA